MIRKNISVLGILQDLFVGMQLAYLGPIAPLFQLLILYDALIDRKTGYRLDLKFFPLVKEGKEFWDSASAIGAWRLMPLFVLLALIPSYFSTPSLWVFLGLPLFFFPADSLLLRWEKDLFRKRPKEGKLFHSMIRETLIRPTEVSTPPSKHYPLYRKVKGFRGEKLPIDGSGSPHIIFLFFESLRAKELHRLPFLSSLKEKSLYYPNFYSNSLLTFRSLFSSLYGLPYELEISAGLDRKMSLYGLPELLKKKGYERNFFKGSGWALNGMGPFLEKFCGDRVYDRKELIEYFGEVEQSSWGVTDEYLFKFTLDHLEKHVHHPQFYTLLTVSSHHPWNVPKSYRGPAFEEEKGEYYPKYLQTLVYTDQCIQRFIEKLKGKDVLLFITGDHGCYFGENDASFEYQRGIHPDNFHVPLLIYGEGRTHRQVVETVGSHSDLLPTVMDLLDLKGYQHSVGKSLLRKDKNPPVFYHNPSHQEGKVCSYGASFDEERAFEGMMHLLFREGRFAPTLAQRKLTLEPYEPPLDWDRNRLVQGIQEASPLVTLNLNRHEGLDDALLRSVAKWNPELSYLSVNQSYRISDHGVQEVIRKCPSLTSLDLSHCPLLSSKALKGLPETFYELNLSGTEIRLEDPIKDLEVLKVEETPFSIADLKKVPHLITLHLSYPSFTGQEIREGIDPLPLYRLSLSECDAMTGEELLPLLKPHPHLRFLRLKRCYQLTDDVFMHLGECALRHLSLGGAHRLTDRGLQALLELSLDALEIQGCPNITTEGWELIEKHRDKFSKLLINT